jgi:uncharacterized protein (DUF1015 family)
VETFRYGGSHDGPHDIYSEPDIPAPAGLVLAPFRGVRYAPERVSGLAEVTSPPYDVVGADALVRLRDGDPHNVVRLTLPADQAGPSDSPNPGGPLDPGDTGGPADTRGPVGAGGRDRRERYREAGRTLRRWIAEGVLVPDQLASLYVYEDRAGGCAPGQEDHLQRGLIGALALSPPQSGVVLPHEDVVPAVVADRYQLMEATEANLEPIFLLYQGGGPASDLIDEVAARGKPVIEAETDDGMTHRLWAVTERSRVAAVAADLAGRHAMIADGHHRYAAYLNLQARRHAEGRGHGPWDYGLALLVDSAVYPPQISPIHRVIPSLAPAIALERARAAFTVRPLPPGTGLQAALHALGDAGGLGGAAGRSRAGGGGADGGNGAREQPPAGGGGRKTAFLVAGESRFYLLTDPDPAQLAAAAPAGRSERWRRLDTSVLHELLIRTVWQIDDDWPAVQVVHDDPVAAVRAAGPEGTAVLCNPLPAGDVLAVASGGEQVPRKSTSFGPKPRAGLVIRSFAYG